jgi:hypothetical protein
MCWYEKGAEYKYGNGGWYVDTQHPNFTKSLKEAQQIYNSISYTPRGDTPNPRTGAVV